MSDDYENIDYAGNQESNAGIETSLTQVDNTDYSSQLEPSGSSPKGSAFDKIGISDFSNLATGVKQIGDAILPFLGSRGDKKNATTDKKAQKQLQKLLTAQNSQQPVRKTNPFHNIDPMVWWIAGGIVASAVVLIAIKKRK